MKKLLTLVLAMLLSFGSKAQVTNKELIIAIENINNTYSVDDGVYISQQATFHDSIDNIKRLLRTLYKDCVIEENRDVIVITGNLKQASSDHFLDINELSYTPHYTLEITFNDSTIFTTLRAKELTSQLATVDDNVVGNIYPINMNVIRYGHQGNRARKIMTNEGFVFINIINQMHAFMNNLNNSLQLCNIVKIIKDNDYDFKAETHQYDLHASLQEFDKQIKYYAKISLTGELIMLGGGAIALSSALYANNNIDIENPNKGRAGIIVGGLIATAGYITKLCSYNQLIKIQINGTSVIYKL